jgi:hypothetical protein
MKAFFFLFILFSCLFFCSNANAQKLQKKYDKAYSYYEKKDYKKAIEECNSILTQAGDIKDLDDLWFLHNTAFIAYFIYNDPESNFLNKDTSKVYLNISRQYLELVLAKKPSLEEKMKPRYDSIQVWLAQFDVKKEVPKPAEKNESSSVVRVVTAGEGPSQELAINRALRQAIEKVLGAFISSKTNIVNDSLLTDEFTSISSGNISSYNIISETKQDNVYHVVVSSSVSPEKIVLSATTKTGKEFELSGGVYYQNILKEEFYKKGEIEVFKNLYNQWKNVPLFHYNVIESPISRFKGAEQAGNGYSVVKWPSRTYNGFKFEYFRTNAGISCNGQSEGLKKYYGENLTEESAFEIPESLKNEELFQIPYFILSRPNSNFINFYKTLIKTLSLLQIKDPEDYATKFGKPISFSILNENQFDILMDSLTQHEVEFSNAGKRIYLRNQETVNFILKKINYLFLNQANPIPKILDCKISVPVLNSACVNKYGNFVSYGHSWGYGSLINMVMPFPIAFEPERYLYGLSYAPTCYLISFTKKELAELNTKIRFEFNFND